MHSHLVSQLSRISLSMFRKNFFGVFHGSISAKVEHNKFLINTKEAIFDEVDENNLVLLYHHRDYRWHEASIDASIHSNIYLNIPDAKFIAYGLPPYTTSYSMKYDAIFPKDYFGHLLFNRVDVYDPKNLDDWYERADVEIYRYMKEKRTHIMIIRGYGIYVYDRDLNQMAKTIAIIENSCRLLHLESLLSGGEALLHQTDLYQI